MCFALVFVFREGHGVSLSGNTKNPPGLVPVSPALGDPALAGVWTGWSPEVSSTLTILWSCISWKEIADHSITSTNGLQDPTDRTWVRIPLIFAGRCPDPVPCSLGSPTRAQPKGGWHLPGPARQSGAGDPRTGRRAAGGAQRGCRAERGSQSPQRAGRCRGTGRGRPPARRGRGRRPPARPANGSGGCWRAGRWRRCHSSGGRKPSPARDGGRGAPWRGWKVSGSGGAGAAGGQPAGARGRAGPLCYDRGVLGRWRRWERGPGAALPVRGAPAAGSGGGGGAEAGERRRRGSGQGREAAAGPGSPRFVSRRSAPQRPRRPLPAAAALRARSPGPCGLGWVRRSVRASLPGARGCFSFS